MRLATYNASLHGSSSGEIARRLSDGQDAQAQRVAAIVQTVRPDVMLINELDFDATTNTAQLLAENFFAKSQGGREPIEYPHIFAIRSNTGVDSGLDLDRTGKKGEAADAWGYGVYPGQYAMAVFSRYPILADQARTFRNYRWNDLVGAKRPVDPATGKPFYDDATWEQLRLSSKNHVDLPVMVGERTLHLLISHPTPPVFDGPENRNGCRNHDEVRFWVDYLEGKGQPEHLIDDAGRQGGISKDSLVVLMGDLNVDPDDGDGDAAAIKTLLTHPRLQDPNPTSSGGAESRKDPDGSPQRDTASFQSGNMRVDYLLPDRRLRLKDSQVFWPTKQSNDYELLTASDHRMVWVEVEFEGQ